MKKYLLIFLATIMLTSCVNNVGSKQDSSNIGNNADGSEKKDAVPSVILKNNSNFLVNVFTDSLRENQLCSIKAGEDFTVETFALKQELVFYITYIVDVGLEIPWFSNDSFIVAVPKSDSMVEAIIKSPASMPVKNCFVIIENTSSKNIIFKQGSGELCPSNLSESTIIVPQSKGLYEINSIYFENFSSFMIQTVEGEKISFPQEMQSFDEGNIYSICIAEDYVGSIDAVLKSINSFNPEIERQIWSFADSTFNQEYCLLRPAAKKSDGVPNGSLIMGTLKKDDTQIGLKKVDSFNSKNILYTAKFSHSNSVKVQRSRVLDFAEDKDGSIIMLLENEFTEAVENSTLKKIQFLVSYDFENKILKWNYSFPFQMIFRADCKNKLITTDDGKIAVAGAVIKNNEMHRYFSIFDGGKEGVTGKEYISDESTDISKGIETAFTSIYSDGTDFYVCGYDNCDFNYSERIHKGIIWTFNSDLTEDKQVCECDNALLFCIDGLHDGSSEWYACGEYCDGGKILKGFFISSEIVKSGSDFIKFSVWTDDRPYFYLNQMCCYKNKIILAGKASSNFEGSKDSHPVILGIDRTSNKILWENLNYKNYSDLGGIIPNGIGSYIVQLYQSKNDALHYVSADLLGNEK